jgi:HlyD family secretion protein
MSSSIVKTWPAVSNALTGMLVPKWRRSEPQEATPPVILEFQWPSTAIINAPVPPSARGMVWIITSMVAMLILATALIPIDRVVTSRGIVVSRSPTIVVQPLDTAIVRSIEVREGQRVRAGEVLARLDPTFAAADLATLAAQVMSLEAEIARIDAEVADQPFVYTGNESSWLAQVAIHAHRIAEFDSKMDNFRHRGAELDATIMRAESDAVGFRERLKVAQQVEDMRGQLEQLHAGSKLQLLQAVDSRAEMARALAYAQRTGEGAKRDKSAVEADRDAYIQGWKAEASQKRAEAKDKLATAREQLNKAALRRDLVVLHSERDAVVQSVAKMSVGSVLQSGQQFITLGQTDVPLEIEANVFGRDSGFVHVGDAVVIKFDTFPYAQYGMAEGKVKILSPTSFNAQEESRNPTSSVPVAQQTPDPFYRARISLDQIELHDVPQDFQVTPGMPVTADIKVGKRTVLKYLLGMVVPVAQEGMREP